MTKTATIPKSLSCSSIEFGTSNYKFKEPRMFFSINGDAKKTEDVRWGILKLVEASPLLLEVVKKAASYVDDNGGELYFAQEARDALALIPNQEVQP